MDEILEEMLSNAYMQILHNEEKILRNLSDITIKELRTLQIIARCERNGNNTSTIVASILGISLGTLTTNIDRLIKKGLVDKDKLVEDKRTTVLTLTQLGKKTLKQYNNEHMKIVKATIEHLTEKEKVVLVSVFNKFDI